MYCRLYVRCSHMMIFTRARFLIHNHPKALRVIGWGCIGLLVWLSWIPRDWETRTSLPGQIEHAIAYCGTAILITLGYVRMPWWRVTVPLVVLAGILEIGQLWVPGRSSQLIDFMASGFGALAGSLIGWRLTQWLLRV